MAETDHLKKISWFEKFTYQLIKDIDHSAFHKKREEKLRKYRSVNSALIRIFAYRLTYRNFEMLNLTISQIAEEIASGEVKGILMQLEAADEKGDMQEGDNASDLIKIIIFLLREEVEKCLDEAGDIEKYLTESPLSDNSPQKKQIANKTQKVEVKEKEQKKEEKADRKWLTSSSGGSLLFKGKTLEDFSKNLSDYEKKAPAVKPEDDKLSLQVAAKKSEDKKIPHPLSDKPKPGSQPKESKVSAKKTVPSPNRTADDLLKNLGGSGLDELIYGTKRRKKDKASGEAVDREQDDALMDWID